MLFSITFILLEPKKLCNGRTFQQLGFVFFFLFSRQLRLFEMPFETLRIDVSIKHSYAPRFFCCFR